MKPWIQNVKRLLTRSPELHYVGPQANSGRHFTTKLFLNGYPMPLL